MPRPTYRIGERHDHSQEDGRSRVVILAVQPEIDGGAYAVKRIRGDVFSVSADLLADGHDIVAGELLICEPAALDRAAAGGAEALPENGDQAIALQALPNDRYGASFELRTIGRYHYTIRAWIDHFATWRRGLERKLEAGQDVSVDLLIGARWLALAASRAEGEHRRSIERAREQLAQTSEPMLVRARAALRPELATLVARYPDRTHAARHARWLPLWVDRERARFGAWYELFPRSTGQNGQHGSFETALARLPYVAAMGFDVLYLPPIHPIGHRFRKGKNNAEAAGEADVGSPWAIGSTEGGHKSVHPALGTLDDFDTFQRESARHGLELCLDIAFQVAPDHPYVKEHPEWFQHRPDASIQYAENPPKKYQDIYPFDFECEAWWSLWQELASVFEFWIARGVRIFRVDNPHTKALPFWQWCLARLTQQHPDLIFLAEAFTRPKLMLLLAKLGFTQSYTYFTWRNTARELRAYVRELTSPPISEFFRPNFWPTTPDILPEHLQHAGRAAFSLRYVLAATLSSNYGIYGPAFELLANLPRAGVEEYADNEKYELVSWDLEREDSLRPLIARINAIRRENAALQQNRVSFHDADNESLLCFSKLSEDGNNSLLVVANMDVHNVQSGWVDLTPAAPESRGARFDAQPEPRDVSSQRDLRLPEQLHELQLHDLLSDARYFSEGRRLFVRLDPNSAPAHIFRLRRRVRTEHDFDYFL